MHKHPFDARLTLVGFADCVRHIFEYLVSFVQSIGTFDGSGERLKYSRF